MDRGRMLRHVRDALGASAAPVNALAAQRRAEANVDRLGGPVIPGKQPPDPMPDQHDVAKAIQHIENAQEELDLALDALQGDTPEPEPPPYEHAVADRDPREKPPLPELGPAGFTFTDPALGAQMRRV